MTTFNTMLTRFKSFQPTEAAGAAMLEEKEQIIGINTDQLYEQGVGKDGNALPPYTAAYAKKKLQQRGKSIVDIYKTGKLQSEMNLRVNGGEFEIASPVPYAQYVLGKRPTIFGLTPEGKKATWFIIHDGFVGELKKVTGAG